MTNKVNSILLIDDDGSTNFFHKIILEEHIGVKHIHVAESAKEALILLENFKEKNKTMPDIIFLDLNMPGMNGWDFLTKYKQFNEHKELKPLIFVLTTSNNPDDLKRANSIEEVSGFKNKPLTEEMFFEIIQDHFGN